VTKTAVRTFESSFASYSALVRAVPQLFLVEKLRSQGGSRFFFDPLAGLADPHLPATGAPELLGEPLFWRGSDPVGSLDAPLTPSPCGAQVRGGRESPHHRGDVPDGGGFHRAGPNRATWPRILTENP
jgi:hypothetical protein